MEKMTALYYNKTHREDKRRLQEQLSKSDPAVNFMCELIYSIRGTIKEVVLTGDLTAFIKSLAASLRPVFDDPIPDDQQVHVTIMLYIFHSVL